MIAPLRFTVCLPHVTGDFQPDLKFVRQEEGGNDDDPYDPGGRTSRGIEQTEYDAWCKLHHLPGGDVFNAPNDVLNAIYYNQYWLPYTDYCPPGVDLAFFDTHVNEGLVPAVQFLQRAVKVTVDGKFGVVTAAAVRGIQDPSDVIVSICNDRRNAYRHMRMFWRYGKGWLSRATACQETALAMLKPAEKPK